MLASISEETLNEWKNSNEARRDNIAVQIGQYMREHKVSRQKAIQSLGVQDPILMEI
jgi:hypothetical protein